MSATLIALGMLEYSLASASWSTDPVAVSNTAANVPMLRSATDGQFGALFVWQQETTPGVGVIRAQRLLASGDLSAVWPAEGAPVCTVSTQRRQLEIVSDDAGGCFVLWTEGSLTPNVTLYAQHMLSSGARDPAWPVRGRRVSADPIYQSIRMSAVRDGVGGFYVTWLEDATPIAMHWSRFRANGSPAAGWPAFGRMFEPLGSPHWQLWPVLALTPDFDVIALWICLSEDPEVPDGYRLIRFKPNGTVAPDWPSDGILAAPFHLQYWGSLSVTPGSLAFKPDGDFYALLPNADANQRVHLILQRRDALGANSPGWEASDIEVDLVDRSRATSSAPRIVPDGRGGVLLARPFTVLHSQAGESGLSRLGPARPVGLPVGVEQMVAGNLLRAAGELAGSCHVIVRQACALPEYINTPAVESHLEIHTFSPSGITHVTRPAPAPNACCFGETAIEPTADGGAIAAWVSTCETRGIFALRTGGAGVVTDVAPARATATGLRGASYKAGSGVRVLYTLAGTGPAEIRLLDLMGRAIGAPHPLQGSGQGELLLATPALRPGMVVVQLTQGDARASHKLIIPQ